MTGVSQSGMSAADVLLRAWFTYPLFPGMATGKAKLRVLKISVQLLD